MRTGNWTRGGAAAVLTLAAILFAPAPAQAQDPAAFYKGRNVDLYIGYSAVSYTHLTLPTNREV